MEYCFHIQESVGANSEVPGPYMINPSMSGAELEYDCPSKLGGIICYIIEY
jgi:hypothetical protein